VNYKSKIVLLAAAFRRIIGPFLSLPLFFLLSSAPKFRARPENELCILEHPSPPVEPPLRCMDDPVFYLLHFDSAQCRKLGPLPVSPFPLPDRWDFLERKHVHAHPSRQVDAVSLEFFARFVSLSFLERLSDC